MGGKKKTKWRKLPLEEFTKEIPPKQEEQPPAAICRTDATREENDFIPTNNGPPEVIQNYTEPYEYIDGIWYPTSCVVYNPGLFSNYMMPADTCYYYCTVPEAGQMQDYMPVPYQEYAPAVPKDIYLLLPTQTLRPTQAVQNVAPEWQSRRQRRRRYEGHAEYAIIPEKTSSSKADIRDHSRLSGAHTRKRTHYSNFRRMSSFSETSSSDGLASEPNPIPKKPNEMKNSLPNVSSVKNQNYINKEIDLLDSPNGRLFKKSPELCDIHSSVKTIKEQQNGNDKANAVSVHGELCQASDKRDTDIGKSDQFDKPLASKNESDEVAGNGENFNNSNKENEVNAEPDELKSKDNLRYEIGMKKESTAEEGHKTDSQNSLPDIVSSLNKTTNVKLQDTDNLSRNHLYDNVDLGNEKGPKPKLPQAINTQLFETLHSEMEMELKLQSLRAKQTNQSVYKLAYDENVTDQSSNSQSPSPILRAEEPVPGCLEPNEIVAHQSASDDNAGSKDLKLIPHRFENESSNSRSPSPRPEDCLGRNEIDKEESSIDDEVNSEYLEQILQIYDNEPPSSRPPSPFLIPEEDIPGRLGRNEIVVHEAASDDDAGSEDLEMIPHRYESESYLARLQHRNLYVNELPLAVELLRTRENLPFDREFKIIDAEGVVEGSANENQERPRRRFTPFPFNPCFCCSIM